MSPELFEYYLALLWANIRDASLLEWIAVLCAVVQVLLAWANKVANYFFGIISTAVYIYIFTAGRLYGDASLNGYYLAMSMYGLWHWNRSRRAALPPVAGVQAPPRSLPVTFCSARNWAMALSLAAGGFILCYLILSRFTASEVPVWDASLTALAWVGMWLLARRKVENWLWLNASNAVAMPLYFFKGWMLTTALTGFLFLVAIAGFFRWRRLASRRGIEEFRNPMVA